MNQTLDLYRHINSTSTRVHGKWFYCEYVYSLRSWYLRIFAIRWVNVYISEQTSECIWKKWVERVPLQFVGSLGKHFAGYLVEQLSLNCCIKIRIDIRKNVGLLICIIYRNVLHITEHHAHTKKHPPPLHMNLSLLTTLISRTQAHKRYRSVSLGCVRILRWQFQFSFCSPRKQSSKNIAISFQLRGQRVPVWRDGKKMAYECGLLIQRCVFSPLFFFHFHSAFFINNWYSMSRLHAEQFCLAGKSLSTCIMLLLLQFQWNMARWNLQVCIVCILHA